MYDKNLEVRDNAADALNDAITTGTGVYKIDATTLLNGTEADSCMAKLVSLDMKTLSELDAGFMAIRDGDRDPDFGICTNLIDTFGTDTIRVLANMFDGIPEFINVLASTWPKHSGEHEFPVPGFADDGSKCAAPDAYAYTKHKWCGKYGEARMELLEYLIGRVRLAMDIKNSMEQK